jgi:hypothetical protein
MGLNYGRPYFSRILVFFYINSVETVNFFNSQIFLTLTKRVPPDYKQVSNYAQAP